MENNEFEFEIITPLNTFLKEKVSSIIVNTPTGKRGIQYLHEPLITCVDEGKLEIKIGEEWKNFFADQGFLEVRENSAILFTDNITEYSNKEEEVLKEIKRNKYEGEQRKKSKIEKTKMESFINRTINNLKYEDEIKK